MHTVDLKDVTYEVVAQNQFHLGQHLQDTVSYMHGPIKQKERWVQRHLKAAGVGFRFDGRVWEDIARLFRLPVIDVDGELYLLAYEFEMVTLVKVAAYQAASEGAIDPSMLDVVANEGFQKIGRETFGAYALSLAVRRMYAFGRLL